jgi:hypothetical protein
MASQTHNGAALEPSFADVMAAIERDQALSLQTKRHWICSLRRIGKLLERPPESIVARWTAARHPVGRLHHASAGCSQKTLANHRANVRRALLWFSEEHDLPVRGTPFSAAWKILYRQLPAPRPRRVLSSFLRYCSARDIAPEAVTDRVLDAYMDYRAATTSLATDTAARRQIARAWNGCIGLISEWPGVRLIEPPVNVSGGPAWEDFPQQLRTDIEKYLAGLLKLRRSPKGRRIRPCKASTIKVRRNMLAALTRKAVALGTPLEAIGDLATLLNPDLIERVLDSYWKESGDEPSVFTIDASALVLSIARETQCLGAEAIEQLEDFRAQLELHRPEGMTEKNLALIRQVRSGDVWKRVLAHPGELMVQARLRKTSAPTKAAVMAQLAASIAILTRFPVRLSNLAKIKLGENLLRPGGPSSNYYLVFPQADVKNRQPLPGVLDSNVTTILDEYLQDFWPILQRGHKESWLFPGEAGSFKTPTTLSEQVTERIVKATGLRITVHQFRHAAAAMFLDSQPGNYEMVRKLLGHRNVQTTIRFYCALETTQATEVYAEIIRRKMAEAEPIA